MITIKRNFYDVIDSLVKKEWFKNKKNLFETFKPNLSISNEKYPYWFDKEYVDIWKKSNEFTRCAIFLFVSEKFKINSPRNIIVSYEELTMYPKITMKKLTEKLNLKMTKKTFENLDEVKVNKKIIDKSAIKKKIDP